MRKKSILILMCAYLFLTGWITAQGLRFHAPVPVYPPDGKEFHNYPRTFTMRWQGVPGAIYYEVEIDCLHCRQAGKWDSEVGTPHRITNIRGTSVSFTFWGDNRGRWRVRAAVRTRRFPPTIVFTPWSSWRYFSFKTGGTQPPPPERRSVRKKLIRFFLDFVDAYLVYEPSSGILQIATEGYVVSYGQNWEKCKIYPYLFHLRRKYWRGFYWKINTSRQRVYKNIGGQFCRIGGRDTPLNFKVDVVGGRRGSTPDRFFIRFGEGGAYLVYDVEDDVIQIAAVPTNAPAMVISRGENWEVCRVKPYLFHLRLKTWKGFYWKVNTSRKIALVVRGSNFCRIGDAREKLLKMKVRVVKQ